MSNRRSLISCVIPSAGVRATLLLVSALAIVSGTSRAQMILVADPNSSGGVRSYNINGTLISNPLIAGSNFEGLALSGSTLYIADNTGSSSIGTATLNGTGGVSSTGTFFVGSSGNGVTSPYGLAVTATDLYVANFNTGNVFQINFTSHLEVHGFYTNNDNGGSLTNPYGLAISGNTLFVSQATTGTGMNTIKGYDLTTFSSTPILTITAGLNLPHGLAVSGNTLYVANGGNGTIMSFDATTGASLNSGAAVVTGLTGPQGITVYGSSLFVTGNDGTVKGFDTSAGYAALGGFTTITGLSSPYGIVVSAIPEPSTYAAIAGAAMLGFAVWRRRNRKNSPAVAPSIATV